MMDTAELHYRAAQRFQACLDGLTPGMWALPTPCPEWDVRAVVAHVTGNHESMAGRLHGTPVEPLADDPAQRWTAAWTAVRSGLALPDALDGLARSPFGGEVPLPVLIRILTSDLTAHTWDVARAVGADETLDADVVADLLVAIEKAQPGLAASGKFGPAVPVPESAGVQERLLGLLGRAVS